MRRDAFRLLSLFLTMACVLLISGAVTYWFGLNVISASKQLIGLQTTIHTLDDTLSTIKDAETGQRGYLITGDARYLDPYRKALEHITQDANNLDQLAKLTPGSEPRLARLQDLTAQKLNELARVIEIRQRRGLDAGVAEVQAGDGKQLMDDIRRESTGWLEELNARVTETNQAVHAATNTRTAIFISCAIINLSFLVWVYRRVTQEIDRSDVAAAESRDQKELYVTTLASIGDAVITTDQSGRITFINPVAEALSGWSRSEGLGRPIGEVFRIINENTRETVDSPVDRVLRTGEIVGLANHTMLIRKDGSEVAIDDSGAPIRHGRGADKGKIDGVVLVFRDFTERRLKEQALRDAQLQAEQANRAKDQFLASLSHELRTPLTPVLATISVWESAELEVPEHIRQDLQIVRRNVELEARLIDDLLDLTRVARGKMSLAVEQTDVHEILHHVIEICGSDLNGQKVNIEKRFEAQQRHVLGDPARLQQVFWNILRNAAKFSSPSSVVTIETSSQPASEKDGAAGQIVVRVIDRGIGMSPEVLSRIFRPFEQGDRDILRRFGGLGLGMAISKALVDVHGGTITAHSDGNGLGSTFSVTLPVLSEAEVDTAVPPRAGRKIDERALQILLVEDHVDTAITMGRLIGGWGHRVHTADTVATALRLAQNERYDLVISDIGLPDGTGMELLQEIRAFSKVPAIALTGFGMEEDIAQTVKAGFAAHITKPVNLQRLESLVQQLTSATGPNVPKH